MSAQPIFHWPGLPSCRCLPVSSNVRQHKAAAANARKAAAAAQYKIWVVSRRSISRQNKPASTTQEPMRSQAVVLIEGSRERRPVQKTDEAAKSSKQLQRHTALQRTANSGGAEAQHIKQRNLGLATGQRSFNRLAHNCSASHNRLRQNTALPSKARECCLTLRSTGAPTAGHQARPVSAQPIFHWPGLPSCRCLPVSSNVRPHNRTPFVSPASNN